MGDIGAADAFGHPPCYAATIAPEAAARNRSGEAACGEGQRPLLDQRGVQILGGDVIAAVELTRSTGPATGAREMFGRCGRHHVILRGVAQQDGNLDGARRGCSPRSWPRATQRRQRRPVVTQLDPASLAMSPPTPSKVVSPASSIGIRISASSG